MQPLFPFDMFHVLCLAQGVNLGFKCTPTLTLMTYFEKMSGGLGKTFSPGPQGYIQDLRVHPS